MPAGVILASCGWLGLIEPTETRYAEIGREMLASRDWLIPHLNGIPLYDPRGRWYGPILSSFGILYNREVLKRIGQPEPRHWADLGEPGLCGWVFQSRPQIRLERGRS